MKPNHARKVSGQAFNQLVEAVEAGKSQKLVDYLKAMGKFHNYSVGNAILIGFQKPNATHVAGFRTWKRLGRYVWKGEHSIAIMAPIVYRKKKEPEESDDKEPEDEEVRTFKTVHVFDIRQTDGKPLPSFARVDGDPGVYIERLLAQEFLKIMLPSMPVRFNLCTKDGDKGQILGDWALNRLLACAIIMVCDRLMNRVMSF